MRHNPGYGIMGQLMGEGGGLALGVAERLERRHLDVVWAGRVISAGATLTDVGTGRGEEPVGGLTPGSRG